VLEAGTGSGAFAIFAANFVKKVLSYEIRKDFIELAKENLKNSGLKNVEILERDVLKEGFSKKNADLVLLDMMDAHKALRFAKEALRVGGVVCVYSPVIEQVQNSLKEMKKLEFSQIELFECLEREWKTEPLRPLSKGIFHTAFLLFGRKIAENAPGAI
jgi:tRNA (adenine57-N1/adenine58-N1)-methyltransferase